MIQETPPPATPHPIDPWEGLKTAVWTVLYLICADIGFNVLFAMPQDVKQIPNTLQAYFEYGRSVEGKLRYQVGPTPERTAPIAEPGWLGDGTPFNDQDQPTQPRQPGQLMIATYGGSFNQRLSLAIEKNYGDSVTVRKVSAPGGPLNWAYAAYQDDPGADAANAVVLTVMSMNITSFTLGGQFGDLPSPYTRPIFALAEESGDQAATATKLQRIDPPIQDLAAMQRGLWEDPSLWQAHVAQIKAHDPYYNPILFNRSLLDRSSLVVTIQGSTKLVGFQPFDR
ncbi:MAG: hypothetical protein ACO34J_03345, partial [Prochlorothrix sp.]